MMICDRCYIVHRLQDQLDSILWPVNGQEPDYVAKLVDTLPGVISNVFSLCLPDRKIKVGSAFIHQKPLAHFKHKPGLKDPELGDLLIVCREKRSFGPVYNAMLLQAKCTKDYHRTNIPNDHQFVLYTEWPEYEYKRAGYLNGKTRSILPKTNTQGAQYLLIDQSCSVRLFTATVDRPLSASKTFARTLAAMMSFDAGRTFQAYNPCDDWSQMILDLLRLSASSVFNRLLSGYVGARRWNGNSAFDYILNLKEKENADKDVNVLTEGEYTGMSVICIDLGSSREEINRWDYDL